MTQINIEHSLDLSVIQMLQELSMDTNSCLLNELIELYRTDSQKYLSLILTAIESDDLCVARTACHALKSASANVGAFHVASLCQRLEATTCDCVTDEIIELTKAIKCEFDLACVALQQQISA